jgi:hypothetical protein
MMTYLLLRRPRTRSVGVQLLWALLWLALVFGLLIAILVAL